MTQRVDGIHDAFPVSDPGHRQDGDPATPTKNRSSSQRTKRGATELTRRPSVSSVSSVVIPTPPRIEPQRALRTQRVDGSHDTLPVSDPWHRQ